MGILVGVHVVITKDDTQNWDFLENNGCGSILVEISAGNEQAPDRATQSKHA
jgi:hypothetical protein